MKRSFSGLLLIAIMSFTHAFAVSDEVAGTTWSGTDIWGKPISLYFADDGSLTYRTSSGIWTTASWRLDESGIYFEMNNKFVEHKGSIHGNEMSGEGWIKQGHKGNWLVTRQSSNLESLVQAKTSAQRAPAFSIPATLLPSEYEGRYESTISFDTTSLVIRFACKAENACELETASVRGAGKPMISINHVKNTTPVSDWSGVQRAFQYARANRAERPSSRENAAVQERLRPLLDSGASIEKCIDLNIGGSNSSILCRPSTSPLGESALLLFGALLGRCGDGFCGYVMYPLLKK